MTVYEGSVLTLNFTMDWTFKLASSNSPVKN